MGIARTRPDNANRSRHKQRAIPDDEAPIDDARADTMAAADAQDDGGLNHAPRADET